MILLIMQFSPASCNVLPVRLKYLPQHYILKHPKLVPNSRTISVPLPLLIVVFHILGLLGLDLTVEMGYFKQVLT
jgi:hypothetical protein